MSSGSAQCPCAIRGTEEDQMHLSAARSCLAHKHRCPLLSALSNVLRKRTGTLGPLRCLLSVVGQSKWGWPLCRHTWSSRSANDAWQAASHTGVKGKCACAPKQDKRRFAIFLPWFLHQRHAAVAVYLHEALHSQSTRSRSKPNKVVVIYICVQETCPGSTRAGAGT